MKKYKYFLLDNKKHIGLFISVLLLVSFTVGIVKLEIWENIPYYTTHIGNNDEEQFIYELTEDYLVQQDFSCGRSFDFVTLSFSDHDQSISGKTIVAIEKKKTGETVYYGEIENKSIHYGDYVEIPIKGGGEADIVYQLSLYEIDTLNTYLGIFGYMETESKTAIVNGEKSDYALSIGMHTRTYLYRNIVIISIVLLNLMLIICLLAVSKDSFTEEKLFICISLPVGIAFLCFLSVNPVHDGSTHLAKVYHYSNVLLGWAEQDRSGYVFLKEDEKDCFDSMYSEIYRKNEQAQVLWEVYSDFGQSASNASLAESHEYRETGASSFLEYFPGVFGMTLGRVLGGGARFNILISKFFFFLFYVSVCYWAIKIAPRMKTCIAFSAMLPMALYQAVGITYDSIVIAVMFLIIAFWLKSREHKLSKKEWLILLVLAYIIGCCKGGFYAVILEAFFLVPSRLTEGIKKKVLFCCSLIGTAIAAFVMTSLNAYIPYLKGMLGVATAESSVLMQQSTGQDIIETVPGKEVVAYGIMHFFNEPLQCIKIIFHTLFEKADYYIGSLIGYRMSWSDRVVPWFVIGLFCILLILGTLCTEESKRMNVLLKERINCVILCFVAVFAFHMLMLIETPQGSDVINGVQGRYFIAWIPIALMAFNSDRYIVAKRTIRRLYLYFGVAEMLFFCYYIKIMFDI